jgi:hypothetical protein
VWPVGVTRARAGQELSAAASPADLTAGLAGDPADSGTAPVEADAQVEDPAGFVKDQDGDRQTDTLAVPLVGLEAEAALIRTYEPLLVPGLFQTEDYARAVIAALRPDLNADQMERWVELRMARQAHFRKDPPELRTVVDEAALRRPVGGRRAMNQQLRQLVDVCTLPTVRLQVLPYEAGEHAGMTGGFTIFSFDEPMVLDTVYLEQTKDDLYLETPPEVQPYVRAFDSLSAAAYSPDASLDFLLLLTKEV